MVSTNSEKSMADPKTERESDEEMEGSQREEGSQDELEEPQRKRTRTRNEHELDNCLD